MHGYIFKHRVLLQHAKQLTNHKKAPLPLTPKLGGGTGGLQILVTSHSAKHVHRKALAVVVHL